MVFESNSLFPSHFLVNKNPNNSAKKWCFFKSAAKDMVSIMPRGIGCSDLDDLDDDLTRPIYPQMVVV